MLRKTGAIVTTFLLSSSSCWSAGFYVGVGTGPEWANFHQNAKIVRVLLDVKDKEHQAGDGWFGSIFGGYWWNCRQFYLAGEVNANASSLEFTSSNKEFVHKSFSHTRYKIDNSFGVSVLPGFLLTPDTLFYGRIGYASGQFKISTSDTSLANVSTYLNGYRLGVGMQQTVASHFDVILDYSHISYDHKNLFVVDFNSNTTKSTRISPQTQQVEFGLIYRFC